MRVRLAPLAKVLAIIGSMALLPSGTQPIAAQSQQYVFVKSLGSSGTGDGQFSGPVDVFVDHDGRIAVVDYNNDRVQLILPDGTFVCKWTGFNKPEKVAQDSAKNYYVADTDNGRVVRLASCGGQGVAWSAGWPRGVGVGPDDSVYVADWNGQVHKYDSSGNVVTSWGTSGSVNVGGALEAVRLDAAGNLYVISGNTVVKLKSDGNRLTSWGAFNFPQDVFVDQSNNVFVADSNNNRVQKFSNDGVLLATIGQGDLYAPNGVSVDSKGNLYVADTGHNRVAIFAPNFVSYSISGRVTDGSSGCISGVSVSDGAGHTSPPSDTYGNYALSGLAAGTYTLGAVKSGCKFWPNAQPIVLSGDATQNFSEWTLGIGKVPVYLQGDPSTPSTLPWHPPWYNQTLLGNASGDTYDTVGRYGCALASYAMILGHYGQLYSPPLQTDPGDLNAHMQGLDPVSFEQYAWSKGVNVFQSGVGPANDFTGLHSQLTKGDLVMLQLGVSGSPTRVHYVVVTGETTVHNQATYTINDPVYGQVTLLGRYGKNDFQAAYYYMLGPTTFNRSAVEISAHSPVQLLVTDTQGRRVGYDPRTGLSYNEIPNAGYVTGAIAGPDGNTLPEFKYVLIPQPSSSSYYLQVIGTGTGGYTIDVIQTDSSGKGSVSRQSGTAQLNSVYSYTIRAASALFLPLIVR
ncbi:MAG: hypothetical protein M1482_16280 [Chloroflexi bacterium]|nr:hypothetical protein [Chloroflexota bacterium]